MSSSRRAVRAGAMVLAAAAAASWAQPAAYPGIGRAATPGEIAAWDIDVRPDFKGLPAGSGSVARGQQVWEGKCASCHGIFGESNQVFSPVVGGTSAEDIASGRVARLTDRSYPQRTTLMKASNVSTLWDYINRAMPWTQPKSLSREEVYAVTAYLLNLGGIVPDDFVLSDKNIADVQQRMPNRNGMTTDHGLWPGRSMGNGYKPDVQGTACMKDCAPEPKVASFLPDFARNAHGNLTDQNRMVGAQLGADTTRAPGAPRATLQFVAPAAAAEGSGAAALALARQHNCTACHAIDSKLVGPSFKDIAGKHGLRANAQAYLESKIKEGGQGVWGDIPMPAQSLPEPDTKAIAQWLATGAAR